MEVIDSDAARLIAIAAERAYLDRPPMLGHVEGWAVASQGQYLLAMQGEAALGETPQEPFQAFVDLARKLVLLEPSGDTVDEALLRRWLLGHTGATCDRCHGTGVLHECRSCEGNGYVDCTCDSCGDNHEYECRSCGGEGETPCRAKGCPGKPDQKRRYGRLSGVPINRHLLAQALGNLPGPIRVTCADSDVSITHGFDGPRNLLVVFGPTWRVLLMACRDSDDYPVFPNERPEVA